MLREGMARGLALIGSFENRPLPGKISCASAVDELDTTTSQHSEHGQLRRVVAIHRSRAPADRRGRTLGVFRVRARRLHR